MELKYAITPPNSDIPLGKMRMISCQAKEMAEELRAIYIASDVVPGWVPEYISKKATHKASVYNKTDNTFEADFIDGSTLYYLGGNLLDWGFSYRSDITDPFIASSDYIPTALEKTQV